MATQTPKRRTSADAQTSKFVKCSVSLDVATHAKLSAAAALSGMDKNAFMYRAISEAVRGIIVIDKRKSDSHEGSARDAAPVE